MIKKLFLASLPYFKKIYRLIRSPCCVRLHMYFPLNNIWMPVPIFVKHGMYIMPPEIIPTAYFILPSHK
jgi:hypothetical protein